MIYHLKRLLALFVPDRMYVTLAFVKSHGRLPRTPAVTFNEHLRDLKSSGALAAFQRFADKRAVRDHVARTVGTRHLVPMYATAARLTPAIWNILPEAFVVKANHGSAWNRIVRSKRREDYASVARQTDGWLRRNFYFVRRERQYRHIGPALIFEALLTERDGSAIRNFKFFCFHGKARFILVTRDGAGQSNEYYDRTWHRLDITRRAGPGDTVPRPETLDEMIDVAERLAADFTFVRVDLYSVERQVFFGELTFVPGGGSGRFRSADFEEAMGRMWAGETVDLTRFRDRRPSPSTQRVPAKAYETAPT